MIHLMELPNPEPLIGRPEHGGRDCHACISIRDVSKLQAILDKVGVYLKGYNAVLKKEIPVLSLSPCHFKLVANDKAIGNGLEMFDGHKTHRSQNSLPISGSGTSKWTS
ncbi:Peroxisome biogenesis 1 -like protein [Gossypium arboreum]|uniref:Peroxisome biogenesis 1-like protein n=1 Tax=Gossypium arboreum TaxID=29729 RepID=A0A0B0P2K8_GOSAR|nr:Peroxisome biogenesis 1 -like protein [Gossypium arboreum]